MVLNRIARTVLSLNLLFPLSSFLSTLNSQLSISLALYLHLGNMLVKKPMANGQWLKALKVVSL